MRRIAWVTLALAAACGSTTKAPSAPLDGLRLPTGLAVHAGHVLVASSNADLFYDDATGGSVLALDASPLGTVRIDGALNVRSFAGDLAVARPEAPGPGTPDAEACGTAVAKPLAIFATRGSSTLNVLGFDPALAASGRNTLSCEACGIPAGFGFGDPLAVAVACRPGKARAFVGYLNTPNAVSWLSELDLAPPYAHRSVAIGLGAVRAFAYDRDRDRLFVVSLSTGSPTPLRWIDLAGCAVGAPLGQGGCPVGSASFPTLPAGLELRSMALARRVDPAGPIRAYLTARLYDLGQASLAGGRNTDLGGLLIVADLWDDGLGGVEAQLVWTVPLGRGAQDVRLLPRGPGWPATRRDVVAALSGDGLLTIYDDETRSVASFGRDETTGAPVLGHIPYSLAVDPVAVGTAAHVWVGSYQESYLTPIEVALDAPDHAAFLGGTQRRIRGATP